MKSLVELKIFKKCAKVTYFTLQYEGHDLSEMDKFLKKMTEKEKDREQLLHIVSWIEDIGNKRGAKAQFFRFENAADALPPKVKFSTIQPQNMRLYCIRLSDSVVVLGNGAIKTASTAQECTNCRPHFKFINSIANQIDQKIRERELMLTEKSIKGYQGAIFEY